MKKITLLIIMFLLCVPVICLASNDYVIDNYYMVVKINKDNNYEVEEDIDVTFHKIDAIIKREMPYQIDRYDVNTDYEVETTDKRIITIKNNGKVEGSYKFSYVVPNNSDRNSYKIEIANNFDGAIKESSFEIYLPNEVTKDNINFFHNGEEITDDIEYKIDGKKITVKYNKGLLKDDKIVLEVKYNQVYFNYIHSLVIIGPVILALISYFIWRYYGKDLKVNVVKSFTLPKDLTPLDIALVKNEVVNKEDVFAFLLYLANKGYIKIIEDDNNNFYLERVKNYDGDNYKEEVFIKALFRKNLRVTLSEYIDIVTAKKQVKKDEELDKKIKPEEFGYRYRRALTNVLSAINNNEEKSIYYELESDRKKNILIFFVAIILVLITSIPFIEINKLYFLPLSVLYSIFILKVLITITDKIKIDSFTNKNNNWMMILISGLVTLISLIMLIPSFKRNLIYTMSFLISFVCVVVILILYKFMPKKTVYGSKIFAKIEGLKIFVDTCDKNNLELAMKKNKNYLYDLLSYSYILENNGKVINLLKSIDFKEPNWYQLKGEFTVVKFNNSLKRLKDFLDKIEDELN